MWKSSDLDVERCRVGFTADSMIDFENNYIVNNLNPDFDLSRYYHPNLLADDWQTIMLNSKIDNEGLIKWNDKIQLYNWM